MRWKKFNTAPIKYCVNEWFYMMNKADVNRDLLGVIMIFIAGLIFIPFVVIYEIIFYLFNKQN